MSRRFAIYCRVSTDEQAANREGSMVSQCQRCTEFLRIKFGQVPHKAYQDEGFSAKDTNRPDFQQLIAAIEAGEIEVVVSTELSRISRSVVDFQHFLDLCNRHQVGLILLRESFDTRTAQGKLMLGIFSSLAQYEREQISERTAANMQARARRGLFNGGRIYGYRPAGSRKGYLEVDLYEAAVLTQIFDKYLELGSYCEVANWLNKQGYRTRAGDPWHKNSIATILKNPAYIGQKVIDGTIYSAVWPPIIDKTCWERVQELLKKNRKCKRNSHSNDERHTYTLSGLLQCTHCKTHMENGSGTGCRGKKVYFYYRHPHGHRKDDCPYTYLPADILEEFIHQQILRTLSDEELLQEVCKEVSRLFQEESSRLWQELSGLKNQISELEAKLSGYVAKLPLLEETLVRDLVTPAMKQLVADKSRLETLYQEKDSQRENCHQKILTPEHVRGHIHSLGEEFEKLSDQEKRQVLHCIIEKIELYPRQLVVWIYAYKKETLSNPLGVRESPNWLPSSVSQRTIPLPIRRPVQL